MPTRVPVALSENPYEVVIGRGLLPQCGELIATVVRPGACALVTDSNVGPLYAASVKRSLEGKGFQPTVLTIPAGEKSKSLRQAENLCDGMIAAGLDRKSLVLALGGGVVGDLAGFVAAIYQRGVPCIQLPTTVMAQVDSSVGGKTGVNATAGKNLIGAFHQPRLVIADIDTLQTLPPRELQEGFAEIVKHAVIREASMLDSLGSTDREDLVARNVAIKAAIVAEDEFETKDLRALLNFGHTIGHGIEAAAGYGKYLHGEAISLGMAAALWLSETKAGLAKPEADKVRAVLKKLGLPLTLPAEISTPAILEALKKDKKFSAGAIRFVLSSKLGSAFVSSDVREADIVTAIESLR